MAEHRLKEKIKNRLKGVPFICKAYLCFRDQKNRVLDVVRFHDARKKQQLICEGSPEAFQDMPLHVQWEITQYCNYHCSYCFQAAGGHKNVCCSLEQAKKAIEHMVSANRPAYQIYLLGGEPLTHPDLIEIVKLLDDHLGEKIQVLRFLTNGSFKPGQFKALTDAARHFPLLLSISVHFEFVKPERILSFVTEYADKTSLELGLLFHPEYFDVLKETTEKLIELRKEYPFDILINKIHEPPAFQRLDSRYTDEHFKWAQEARRAFDQAATEGPAVRHDRTTEFGRSSFFTEKKTASGIERKEYSCYEELDEATDADFSGMYCSAGTMVLTINTSGRVKGTRCPAAPTICNIYEENPFERDDWMFAHPCTRKWCSDVANRRTAKFLSRKDAEDYLRKCREKQKALLQAHTLPSTIRIDASSD